jgi:hypothetical protein
MSRLSALFCLACGVQGLDMCICWVFEGCFADLSEIYFSGGFRKGISVQMRIFGGYCSRNCSVNGRHGRGG